MMDGDGKWSAEAEARGLPVRQETTATTNKHGGHRGRGVLERMRGMGEKGGMGRGREEGREGGREGREGGEREG